MTAPQPAIMLPKEITDGSVVLSHKASASIHYSFVQGTQTGPEAVLVVFLNGLMTNKTTWLPIMADIIRQRVSTNKVLPSMLAYDRYGQGLTEDRDPKDQGAEPGHGHDVQDAATDLYHLIEKLAPNVKQHVQDEGDKTGQRLVLVGNSIGCAIARLYAQSHPVSGVILLDSVLANSDFDVLPDPADVSFDEKKELPEDVNRDELKESRTRIAQMFHPSVPNREGLSRRNLPELLPFSDRPRIKGQLHAPWVTVYGHDFETFAEESARPPLGLKQSLTMRYVNPYWQKFNKGLAEITRSAYSKGPLQAKGCGHFIQRDDPNLVVTEVLDIVDKVSQGVVPAE